MLCQCVCGRCYVCILQHKKILYGWCYCQYVCGRCYNHRGWCYCPFFWLMLLPMCGRWYSHFGVMWWLMLLPSGRWNGHCRLGGNMLADVIAKGHYCFDLSSGMLNRTSSHMCGRWYLPTFLFRDGLLTPMNRSSFIALLRFWSSLQHFLRLEKAWVGTRQKLVSSSKLCVLFWRNLNLQKKCIPSFSYPWHATP